MACVLHNILSTSACLLFITATHGTLLQWETLYWVNERFVNKRVALECFLPTAWQICVIVNCTRLDASLHYCSSSCCCCCWRIAVGVASLTSFYVQCNLIIEARNGDESFTRADVLSAEGSATDDSYITCTTRPGTTSGMLVSEWVSSGRHCCCPPTAVYDCRCAPLGGRDDVIREQCVIVGWTLVRLSWWCWDPVMADILTTWILVVVDTHTHTHTHIHIQTSPYADIEKFCDVSRKFYINFGLSVPYVLYYILCLVLANTYN